MKDLHLMPQPYLLPGGTENALLVTHYTGEPHFFFHYHPEYELTLTMGSAGRRLVGNRVDDYSEEDFVLLGPNLPHTWAADSHAASPGEGDNVVIHFTRESIGVDFLSRSELKEITGLLDRAHLGLRFRGPAAETAARRFREVPQLSSGHQVIALLYMLQELAEKARIDAILPPNHAQLPAEREHVALAKVLKFIHQHSDSAIQLKDIASYAAMSVPTFCRFFRRASGRSFVDYLNDWRVSRACALLLETSHSVLEISELSGFRNLSHFNRQFLRRRKMTPSEFRVRHAKQ